MATPKVDAITAQIARWAAELRFEDLDDNAVHTAKRCLLDAFGCALGGYGQEDVRIALSVLDEIAGPGTATVIGIGKQVDPVSAAFANALMVRVMDYNDIYWQQDPCHPSDLIPAAIACGERQQRDGRDLIVAIVLGYEFAMRLCESAFPGIRDRGWHHATFTSIAAPIAAAKMLGLQWKQIQHAVGISASRHVAAGAVTAGELSMMKNTADPLATQSGVLAALLAERGYTGPSGVIDGKEGLVHCFGPEWKLDALVEDLGKSWRIEQISFKAFPTEALTHAPLTAVLDLMRDHDLIHDRIEHVRVRTLTWAADILADRAKYDPRTKETADHSLPYVIAAALVDQEVTPAQFETGRIMDPTIRAQLNKVEVIADPDYDNQFPQRQQTEVTIKTTDGRILSRQLQYPKGDPRSPLTDEEIKAKFDTLAAPVLTSAGSKELKTMIWQLEKLGAIAPLMQLCRAA
ncbi:MAG: MmgE/PrpD family protein [Acidiferrobacterales bacterium]